MMIKTNYRTKVTLALYLLASVFFFHANSYANSTTQPSTPFNDSNTISVFVDDNITYIGTGRSLTIVDVSDPKVPLFLGKSDVLPNLVKDIDVVGDIAYVTYVSFDYDKGLAAIDVSDPANPVLLGRLNIDDLSGYGASGYLQVVENIAYIFSGGLQMVDVTDPTALILLETDLASQRTKTERSEPRNDNNHSHGTKGLHIVDNTAYILYSYYGIQGIAAVDLTDPSRLSPNFYGYESYLDGFVNDVFVADNIAYIAHNNYGLVIMDLVGSERVLSDEITGNDARQLIVEDNIAYVSKSRRDSNTDLLEDVIDVVNVNNPENPVLIGSFNIPNDYSVKDMYLAGNTLYLAGGTGLLIVDVTSPSNPLLQSSFIPTNQDTLITTPPVQKGGTFDFLSHLGGSAKGVVLEEDVAYVGTGSVLTIFDTSDPANATIIGQSTLLPGTINDIDVVDNVAYITVNTFSINAYGANSHVDKLVIVDVNDLRNPTVLASLDSETGSYGTITVSNGTAYINSEALIMVDVKDARNPVHVGSFDGVNVGKIQIINDVAYTINETGLVALSLNDPHNPTVLSSFESDTYFRDFKIVENIAYLAGGNDGLITIDVSNRYNFTPLGSLDTVPAYGLDVVGGVVYVASDYQGVSVVDVTNPAEPSLLSVEADGVVTANDVIAHGDNLYVLYSGGSSYDGIITIMDISVPHTPETVGFLGIAFASSIDVVDDIAYIANSRNGMVIVDISNRKMPVTLSRFETEWSTRDIQVVDKIAYVTLGDGGLLILDVSDPRNPTLIATFEHDRIDGMQGVAVANNVAYIANWNNGILIVDVTDPSNPTLIVELDIEGQFERIVVEESIAYIDSTLGLHTMDVSDPSNPVLLDMFDVDVMDFQIVGDVAYIAADHKGLALVDVSDPSNMSFMMEIEMEERVSGVSVDKNNENIVYVADERYLNAIDITNLQKPYFTASLKIPGYASNAYWADDVVYQWSGSGLSLFEYTPIEYNYEIFIPFVSR